MAKTHPQVAHAQRVVDALRAGRPVPPEPAWYPELRRLRAAVSAVVVALSDARRREHDAVIEATRCDIASALADRVESRRVMGDDWEVVDYETPTVKPTLQ